MSKDQASNGARKLEIASFLAPFRAQYIPGLVIAIVVSVLFSLPVMDIVQRSDTDILHWLRAKTTGGDAPPSDAVVIAIDEKTYDTRPFVNRPKAMWTPQIAVVQDKVLDAGATVFGWDLVLPTSANTYVADERYDKPLLVSLARNGKRQGKVVLGEVNLGSTPISPYLTFKRMVGAPKNLKSLNLFVEEDAIVRGLPLLLKVTKNDGEVMLRTGFAAELAARHTGMRFDTDSKTGSVIFGGAPVPTVGDHNMLVNFDHRPGSIPTYSLQDIFHCAQNGNDAYFAEHFKGKAVILGVVLNLEDRLLATNRFVTDVDFAGAPKSCTGVGPEVPEIARNATPGVYIHANAINNLIRGNAIDRLSDTVRHLATLIASLLAVALALRFRPQRAILFLGVICLAYIAAATVIFRTGMELPLIDPILASALAFSCGTGYRFVTTDRERRRVRQSFSHYLDPKVIDAMLESGDLPELGGESRHLTCFFSDIAAFSTISEKMTPHELVEFLNEYFDIIGREIENNGGIIERFLGDAVCAVFGAPVRDEDHAASAVKAAIAIDRGLKEAGHRFKVPEGMSVKTRIGINSGPMTVGNVGSRRRYTYTVMGDAVNLAARLEGVNKQYGTLLMAGDDTVDIVKERFEWREIDTVRVVGRDKPVTLYEPLGLKGQIDSKTAEMRDSYEAALALYRARRFEQAREAFAILSAAGDAAAGMAVARCDALLAVEELNEDWNGVTDLTSK